MSYVYVINSIGYYKFVCFTSKQSALNYAKRHNLPKIPSQRHPEGRYVVTKVHSFIASRVRKAFELQMKELHNKISSVRHINQ